MELILERIYKTKDYTMGSLTASPTSPASPLTPLPQGEGNINDFEGDINECEGGLEGLCDTLEPPEGTATEAVTSGSRKAIAPGRYRVRMAWSQRFQQMLPRLEGVPGRSGILIHAGNTVKDTVGCILVGKTPSPPTPEGGGKGKLINSRITLNWLMGLIKEAINKGEEVVIRIKD